MTRVVESIGFTVDGVADVDAAAAWLARRRYGAVVLDLSLGAREGVSLLLSTLIVARHCREFYRFLTAAEISRATMLEAQQQRRTDCAIDGTNAARPATRVAVKPRSRAALRRRRRA
jgi:DNA-binding response OmpR family regulator